MSPLLAQVPAESMLGYLVIGVVVVGLSALVQLVLAGKQLFGGNKGERQIEPTQLAAITSALKEQTDTLNNINREVGEVKAGMQARVAGLEVQMLGMHTRVGGISRDLAGVQSRVEGLEKREGR